MLVFALALAIGASLVLLGAGGSIVTVPALVYAGGLDAHRAAGTSLLVVGLVAAAGALARRRLVALRVGGIFGGAGMLGAAAGAWLNHAVPEAVVMLAFSVTVLLAARRMAGGAPLSPFGGRGGGWRTALACGLAVGVATGFFGVGGGFLIVPALTVCLGVGMEAATATSLLVIALNSAAGLAGHAAYGAVDWRLGAAFAATALAGAALALPFGRRIPARALQRAFAALLVAVGLTMLAHTALALSRTPPPADDPPRATP